MDGEETLFFIEDDIKKKYKIDQPCFSINGKIFDIGKDIIDWIDENYWNDEGEVFWVKYRHISDDLFELKMFPPDPPIDVRKKIVLDYINFVKKETPNPYFKIGKDIYNEDDARKVLLEELSDGSSILFHNPDYFPDPNLEEKRIIYEVVFCEHELYWDIESGYRTFEDK